MNKENEQDEQDGLWASFGGLPPEVFEIDEPPAALRKRVFSKTRAVVRRRKRRGIGSLVVAYAAGLLTATAAGLLWWGGGSATPGPGVVPALSPVEAAAPAQPVRQARSARAQVLEAETLALRLARANVEERSVLLKEMGDRLLGQGEVRRAAHYYSKMLDTIGEGADVAFDVKDSWLLATLKLNRLEERHHEQLGT